MFSESFSKGVGLYNNTAQPLLDRQPHCKLARAKARVKIDSLYDKYRRENERLTRVWRMTTHLQPTQTHTHLPSPT